jgi:hypothetical protein
MTELLKGSAGAEWRLCGDDGPLGRAAFRGFRSRCWCAALARLEGILTRRYRSGCCIFRRRQRGGMCCDFAGGAAFGWMRQGQRFDHGSTVMHSAYNALFFIVFVYAKALKIAASEAARHTEMRRQEVRNDGQCTFHGRN